MQKDDTSPATCRSYDLNVDEHLCADVPVRSSALPRKKKSKKVTAELIQILFAPRRINNRHCRSSSLINLSSHRPTLSIFSLTHLSNSCPPLHLSSMELHAAEVARRPARAPRPGQVRPARRVTNRSESLACLAWLLSCSHRCKLRRSLYPSRAAIPATGTREGKNWPRASCPATHSASLSTLKSPDGGVDWVSED